MARKCSIYNYLDKTIGDNIYKERRKRRLSREKVAKNIDVSGAQIQKYEKNLNRISASRLFILAKYFNLSIYDFLAGDVKESWAHDVLTGKNDLLNIK